MGVEVKPKDLTQFGILGLVVYNVLIKVSTFSQCK